VAFSGVTPSAQRLPREGSPLHADARAARRRFALVQISMVSLAAITGGLLVLAIRSDPGLGQVLGQAPAWLLLVLVALVGAAATLTWKLVSGAADDVEAATILRRRPDKPTVARRGSAPVWVSGRDAARDPGRDSDRVGAAILFDSLTGLGNHRAFQEALERELRLARGRRRSVAIGLIDLDDFRHINDLDGHAIGDAVLVELAKIVRQGLRRGDQAFRIAGDEFAVILPGVAAEEAAGILKRALADCVRPRLESPVPRGFSFSAGVTDAPARGLERNDLVAQAEDALLDSKRGGRTSIRVYDPVKRSPLDDPAIRRASAAVLDVVRTGSLLPVYQPIVEVATGRVVGFEGLVRPAPGSGFEDPGSLFAVAEATGRTSDLDRLCVETLAAGARALAPDQTLSINLSPRTLEAPEFSVPALIRMLGASGLDPRRIVLELTERQAVTDMDALRRHLGACQAAGFRVAVDDVGSGNAGLRLLSQLHFDTVKIDVSLVQAGAQRQSSLEVVRSLTQLAARWEAKAVAEGVETPAQLRMVRDLGLAEVQGYLVGAPSVSIDLRRVDLGSIMLESSIRASLGFRPVPASPLG
jgi:diguanylate cyclase (GGDEF)-like protein